VIKHPIFLSATLLVLAACASNPAPAATPEAYADTPRAAPASGYTLVLIRTGPRSGQLSAEENQRAFEGHFANMARMAEAGQLVVAGPYGEERHAQDLRGLFVLDTTERSTAEAWAGTDPTTQAGVFRLEFHDLVTDAALRRALEEDLAWRARETAAGRTLRPGEGCRTYVLLTAADAEAAWRELSPLWSGEGGVLLLARLDGSRALALLDAPSAEEARTRFAPQLEHVGACELDEWFASSQLARLNELAGG
jgi:uncharacterized protein YciI